MDRQETNWEFLPISGWKRLQHRGNTGWGQKRGWGTGFLQRQVAEKVGVTASTFNNWELQRNSPEIRFIAPVIESLGYEPLPKPASLPEAIRLYRSRHSLSQASRDTHRPPSARRAQLPEARQASFPHREAI